MGSPEIANPFSGINGQMANGRGCSPENPYGDGNVRNGHRTIPYIEITEQPASKALRFRYECEGRSAGSIPGVHSTPENKTYPKIRIVGFKGLAVVVVSCVTKDEPYQAHPHNLVGKEGCKNGICTVEINNEDMTATFQNLGIQCVKKKDIEEALTIREKIRVDPFRQGFNHKSAPSQIDLNAVRLCFQAFLQEPGQKKFNIVVQPVISEPIYDKKAMSDLVITKLSHASGPATGHQEMILLCEKVVKEDIEVVFLEEVNGEVIWESKGEFSTNNVHKQVAIVFKTPPYKDPNVSHKVKVYIHLKRPSDKACSDPVPFYYTPSDSAYGNPPPRKVPKMQDPIMYPNDPLMDRFNPGSPQTPYVSPPHPTQMPYPIKTEPGGSPNYAPFGTSPAPYLPPVYHNLEMSQCPQNSLPPFNTFAPSNTMNASPLQVNPDYAALTVLDEFMEANQSTSTASILFNLNVNQPMNELQSKHESAISSIEFRINTGDLLNVNPDDVPDVNCPIDTSELSQNLSQSLIISGSGSATEELRRIVNEKASECL